MSERPPSAPDAGVPPRGGGLWPPLLIAAAGLAAYADSLSGPFVLDDVGAIAQNPTLRRLGTALVAPVGTTAAGRPVLNLTLAANYAIGGASVWGYHAANLAIHLLAGLTLYGIVRRTLAPKGGPSATLVAFSTALLWVLHPLQTEAVTYIVQRAESLMGLFFLLTLYAFIRGAGAPSRKRMWYGLCLAACLLGMATKEVMVSAPLIVLLYDRTFVAGTFGGALRRRAGLYAGLAATWLVLPLLVLSTRGRNGSAGFGAGMTWWSYALTQFPAIVHYLRLCAWPHPLVFDYGTALAAPGPRVLASALAVAGLIAATAWALARRPALGFLGASFFAILAPSSSVVPVATQTLAEHRMYLPLAAVLAAAVAGLHRLLGRRLLPATLLLAAVLGVLTWQRNAVYRSDEGLWRDTVNRRPGNDRAHNNLGSALGRDAGRSAEAMAEYAAALRLNPANAQAHNNLGNALGKLPGRLGDAVSELEAAARLKPDYAQPHNNLGILLEKVPGRLDEAVAQYGQALQLNPDDAEAHLNLGNALERIPGREDEAVAQYREALRLIPNFAPAHNNLGIALQRMPGRLDEAVAQYEAALKINPGYAEAHNNLGNALQGKPGRLKDAVAQYEAALRLNPDYAQAHNNLGNALERIPGCATDAVAEFERALRADPGYAEAHNNLGSALKDVPGRLGEAVDHLEEALRLRPDFPEAHFNLANALGSEGRAGEAIAQFEAALRLEPANAEAHNNLGNLLQRMQGRLDEAITQYGEALRLRPDYAEAHSNLGNALNAKGLASEAVLQYAEALRLRPDVAGFHLNLAVTLLRLPGREDDAEAQLRETLRLQPDNAAARQILSDLGAPR